MNAQHSAHGCADRPVRHTSFGAVQGSLDPDTGVEVFKNIPYAQALRFGEPMPPSNWDGVRQATEFGPGLPCLSWAKHKHNPTNFPQIPEELWGEDSPEGFESEQDGFNLNVWTPAQASDADGVKRPVLFYVCGGAFMLRGPPVSAPVVDCASLAHRGDCVCVNVNVRTFGMGFLYKNGGDIPPNLGLLDIVAALEWVQAEIASFGGDPGNVTIWGESEGGAKVNLLLGSPYAVSKRLFHRVQSTSGGVTNFQISEAEADVRARRLAEELKIPYEELCVDALRAIPLADLIAAFTAVQALQPPCFAGPAWPGGTMPFLPVACGKLYPEGSAQTNVLAGCGRDIPLFIGCMRFEKRASSTVESCTESLMLRLDPSFGDYEPISDGWAPSDCAQAYFEATDDERSAASAFQTELSWGLSSMRFQDAHGAQGNPCTFVCRVDFGSEMMEPDEHSPPDHKEQAGHFCDVAFWFRKIERFPNMYGMWNHYLHAQEESLKLQDAMSDMLLAFARTGNPSIAGFDFPAYGDQGSTNTVVLGTPDCHGEVFVEEEGSPDSRVALIRKAWRGLWQVPRF